MSEASKRPWFSGQAQSLHHEMRTAENSAAHLLPKLESMKSQNPDIQLLDVGAGSGTISATLARAIPQGKVSAVDVNEDILPRARTVAEEAGISNIEFQVADAHKLPFPDATFDVVHCHQVLCHLADPWVVLKEMLRVTKPGGIVAAREGDYRTEAYWPQSPGLDKFQAFIAGVLKQPTAGRELLSWALKAGVEREKVTFSFGTWCYAEKEERGTWGIVRYYSIVRALAKEFFSTAQAMIDRIIAPGRMRDRALASGLVTESDLSEMATAWKEWVECDDATLGMMHGEILIQK